MRIKEQGFLLFELLLVFALVSIIIGLTFSQMQFLTHGYVRSEMETLYQMCIYAQRRAMSSGQVCMVNLDVDKQIYSCNAQTCALAKGVCFGFKPGIKGPPSAPQQAIKSASTFRNNSISCSPEGIIDAGTIYMTDNNRQCLYALTSGVAPYSYIRIYRYVDAWQRLE